MLDTARSVDKKPGRAYAKNADSGWTARQPPHQTEMAAAVASTGGEVEGVVMGELMVDGGEAITGRVSIKQVERNSNCLVRWSDILDISTHGGWT